ncbi:AN1-type zinc finger protein 2A isoform X1 [Centruroides vittatus]|uniref:AN1-type zinc finger protein 2A isoform X1 n=1 Tax=Centruroides vittatus TaxID=120091 RepID=UPI0035107BA5
MELPDLGEHCSEQTCNRLDFLSMKCDACKKVFCGDHFQYAKHNCKDAYRKDVQVPVCPLCNKPIPVEKGQIPDIVVGQHIDTFCKSDPSKTKRKIYTNKCALKGCKQKEMVKIFCNRCKANYCLKHRLPQDHHCEKFVPEHRPVSISNVEKKLQEEEDYLLAKALAASEQEQIKTRTNHEKNSCRLS